MELPYSLLNIMDILLSIDLSFFKTVMQRKLGHMSIHGELKSEHAMVLLIYAIKDNCYL